MSNNGQFKKGRIATNEELIKRSNLFSFEEMKQLGETIRNIKKCRLNRD